MGNDVCQAWVGNNYAMEGIVHQHEGETHIDDWGIEWVKEGCFNQIRRSPLQDAGEEEMAGYRFPEPRIEALLDNMRPVMAQAEEMFIGCDASPCAFELMCRVRGMENAILDLAEDSLVTGQLLQRAGEFSLHLAQAACDRFALDWLWTGDDVGGQQCIMMSPECWRERIRPLLDRVFQVGKSRGLWVAYHSCGAIRPIIGDLVEMGLDVLNPIQGNCPGMEPLELKREFGDKLAFMGGVDTQELLPRGSAVAVRREIARLLEGMTADGGGYILAASHTVPPETPLENIFAMYEVAGIGREQILDRAAAIRAG
jgi:uroporphyrinogen decarboxylase